MQRFYMGASALSRRESGLRTYDTLDEAITAVSETVGSIRETRYVVEIVAEVKPMPPPVQVTKFR